MKSAFLVGEFEQAASVNTVTKSMSTWRHFEAVLRLIFRDWVRHATISKRSCDLPHGGGATSYL
jgi:hypothetical protein